MYLAGGSDGGRHRVLELFAPRRLVVPDLRPRRRRASYGSETRYSAQGQKLTPEDEAHIRAFAGTRSLRSLAAEFGVSHETVRSVLQAVRWADSFG